MSIDIRTPVDNAGQLVARAFAWLSWVDATFSTYRRDSEVSRIGRGALDPRHAHPAVWEVVAACDELRAASGGYFDAWAGGGDGRGFDPSGYVKGWAGERVSQVLHRGGAVDHCVNLGGDVRVRGHACPGGEVGRGGGWRIGIRDMAGRIVRTLVTDDLAVATSGAYERGAHIINPMTGEPAAGLDSATVTGPDLGVADAFATALFAAGDPSLAARLPAGYRAHLRLPAADGT